MVGGRFRGAALRAQPKDMLAAAAFSPDGRIIATATRREAMIVLWDASTGESIRELRDAAGLAIHTLCFAADGKSLSAFDFDGGTRRWDVGSGDALGPPEGQIAGPQRLVLTADRKTLITGGSDGVIRLWDTETGRERRRLLAGGRSVQMLTLSLDDKRLATRGSGEDVRLWEVDSGKALRLLPIAPGEANIPLAFSPNGVIVATGGRVPRLWQADTGRERAASR